MPIKTALTEMLGIEHPIVQGGMHYVGYADLAAAVSNAGGLGIITSLTLYAAGGGGAPGVENLRKEIRKCKSMTNKPFGVNCTMLPIGVQPDWPNIMKCIIDEGVKVVETAGRIDDAVPVFKAAGLKILHKCVTIRHAEAAVKLGVDAISMDGFDCAGHPGEYDIGNWILLAKAGKKLKVPFIASGGCATGTQLAAALALGACGVNMGTRMMATKEAPVHENIKKAMVEGDENSTTLVMRSLKNSERVFKNETSMKVVEIEKQFPGDFAKIAEYVKGENYRKSFQETGDTTSSVWSCGQVMGLIESIPSCSELINGMVKEAEETMTKGVGMISKM